MSLVCFTFSDKDIYLHPSTACTQDSGHGSGGSGQSFQTHIKEDIQFDNIPPCMPNSRQQSGEFDEIPPIPENSKIWLAVIHGSWLALKSLESKWLVNDLYVYNSVL